MRKFYLLLFIFILFSCKEEAKNDVADFETVQIQTEKGKKIAIDSAFFSSSDKEIKTFYENNNYQTYWLDSDKREKLLSFIENIEDEGLNNKDFSSKKLQKNEEKLNSLNDKELVSYDILLSENLLKFIKLGSKGKLNPKELYNDWDLRENKINFSELLLGFQKTDTFEVAFQKVEPNHIVYKKLKDALKIINSYPDDNFKKIEISEKIVLKDTNIIIKEIKKRLIYWKDLPKKDTLTDIYDDETLRAVKRFQLRHGLATDGVIGKGTINSLNITKSKRKEQIIANMERWRWFPRNFEENYLIINIPDYVLHFVKNNDTIVSHKVVVGTSSRKTPILSSKLSYMVLNPTWTVPPTIIKEDLIPSATRNRSYFSKKNITIYDSNGKVVSPSQWEPSRGKSYRYVQSPGAFNSLGKVKMIFPNRFMVYLHDTNHRDYFSRNNRSLSSGCVRVDRPLELAATVLNDSIQWKKEDLEGFITDCNTTKIDIKENIYIYQLYWTAWSDNGALYFIDDIYNLDQELYKKLRN